MNHDDIRHKLSDYLDNAVSDRERSEIEGHLGACAACRDALAELGKTIEHIRAIEEVEPPLWLAGKIAAAVREEADRKKSLWQRLFFPLGVKVPVQAAAMAFLAVTAFYLYQSMQPGMQQAEFPAVALNERPAPRPDAAAPVAAMQAPSEQPAQPTREFAQKLKNFADSPPSPAEIKERSTKEREYLGAARKREEAKSVAGRAAGDDGAPRAAAPAAGALMDAAAVPGTAWTVLVKDMHTAGGNVRKLVEQLGGKVISAERGEHKTVLIAELDSGRLKALFEKLKDLGEVRDRALPATTQEARTSVRIEVIQRQ